VNLFVKMNFISNKAKTKSVVYSVRIMLWEVMLRRLLSRSKLSRKSLALKHNSFIAFWNMHFKINCLSDMNMSITYIWQTIFSTERF